MEWLPYLQWVPFFFAAIVIIGVGMMITTGLRFRRAFQGAAKTLGIRWESEGLFGPGSATGNVKGQTISIFIDRQGLGYFERMLTVVELDLDPTIEGEFSLRRETVFNRISHTVGTHDYEFNDKPFDDMYNVEGEDPTRLGQVFNRQAREALVSMAKGSSDVRISPTRLRWEYSGRVLNGSKLVRVAEDAQAAANFMREG